MCFNYCVQTWQEYFETRFKAIIDGGNDFKPVFLNSAAKHPFMPIITNEHPDKIQFYSWSLIPFWTKDIKAAEQIRRGTFNARNDGVFTKPSYRSVIMKKRCLVLADGFFEWHLHEETKKKYPYFIKFKDGKPFAFAGLWDSWIDQTTEREYNTYTIITTEANPLLAEVHNEKKRMPVILSEEDERKWLDNSLTKDEVSSLLKPYGKDDLEAYPVAKHIILKGENDPDAVKKQGYDNLSEQSLF